MAAGPGYPTSAAEQFNYREDVTMKHKPHPKAFTLLEILIATSLIVLIVSVCYGTFKAVTQTTARIKPQINAAPTHRALTSQVARQLRGSLADFSDDDRKKSSAKQIRQEHTPILFQAKENSPDGIFLQYITTHGFYFGKDLTRNLLAVRYRFDPIQKKWFYQQQPFIQGSKPGWSDSDLGIAENIEALTIRCFDGKTWKSQWNFSKTRQLPTAVHIEYIVRDHNDLEQTRNIYATINTRVEAKDYTTTTPDHEL